MPIPVGPAGNVDTTRGTQDCPVCGGSLVTAWRSVYVRADHLMREWLEPVGVQQWRSVCRTCSTCFEFLAESGGGVQPVMVASSSSVAELPNDADGNGTDDALGGS